MRKKVTIIGGGACALMLGCELDPLKFEVAIYEKNAALGRKFLVAGDGGLNLTHTEDKNEFIKRYTPSAFIEEAFSHFSNTGFMAWLNGLGIETFVGSSGRVFPLKGTKPIEVLNTLLDKIKKNAASLHFKHEWLGFSANNALVFKNSEGITEVQSDHVIFCMGGASWPVTGSTGHWAKYFEEKNITVNPFLASNCAFKINWDKKLLEGTEGKALKNCAISSASKTHVGEVVITNFGIEGSGIYPLSPQIREQLKHDGKAEISIDLKPSLSFESLLEKLSAKKINTNFTAHLKAQLNLNDTQLRLLKYFVSKDDFLDINRLCKHIKNLKLTIAGTGPVDDAISTAGGIDLLEIDRFFELKKMPGFFAIGEMLDYDAPTGGYLLQSCFSMAKFLAGHFNVKR